ncbi:hypothetical protein FOA52_000179 [Chlamydomonas sp. UWO 241]|nr:hypothetical protein FOA52_000179 [Chlamydomonas sp. UWO 241]
MQAMRWQTPGPHVCGQGWQAVCGRLMEEWRGEVVHLSWLPRAFLLKGLLTDAEADHLIELARAKLSTDGLPSSTTGTGAFLEIGQDEIVAAIEKRVAQVTMIPRVHQEPMLVLRHEPGQEFRSHLDTLSADELSDATGRQRVSTLLMYLSTPETGGETVFAKAGDGVVKPSGREWSPCALSSAFAVKAFKGDALLIYGLRPDGTIDALSEHASCPSSSGDSWVATKHVHVAPHNPAPAAPVEAGGCTDGHQQCTEWAYFDECTKNPTFMNASCRKACKLC